MTSRRLSLACFLVVSFAAAPTLADDLRGSDRFLCSSVTAARCFPDGECVTGVPWDWNIPQFIEIDLEARTLATTRASGENRTTPIKNVERSDDHVFLQGVEGGRAFSFTIDEVSGLAAVAVARAGLTVSVFASCTPMP